MSEEEAGKGLLRAQKDAINALRSTIHSQEMSANRSLQVLNAGGVVALLAFLGQTWDAAPELRIALIVAIFLTTVGLCLAVWGGFQLPAYSEWGFRQHESAPVMARYGRTQCLYLWTVRLSFLAFLLAVSLLLVRVAVVS